MKTLQTLIVIAFFILSSCSDNSNRPEVPAPAPGAEPTVEDLIALCSLDPALLTEEVLAQCEELKKQQEIAELIKICSGDPATIPVDMIDKCKELEQAQIDQLNDGEVLTKCKQDPTSLPDYISSQCSEIIKYSEMSLPELVKVCNGDKNLIPKFLTKKCEEITNPKLAEVTFEKNGVSRLTLSNLEMKQPKTVVDLDEVFAEPAKIIASDFKDCGLSLNGAQCVDRKVESKKELGEYVNASNELVYAVELTYLGSEAPVIIVFTQEEKPQGKYFPKSAEVFVKLYDMVEGVSLDSYLSSMAVEKILEGNINAVSKSKRYTLKLAEFKNIRSLYHHLVGVVATTDFSGLFNTNYSNLMREINLKKSVIEKSDNEIYQLSMLILLKDGLQANGRLFLDLCKKMENAELIQLKQYVSVYLGLNNPRTTKYRADIVGALNHEYANLRLDAMRYLVRKTLTTNEKNKMLLLANDSDRAVRTYAANWAQGITLSQQNIVSVKVLAESSLVETRKLAVSLLNKVNSLEATKLLIKLMGDREDIVRSLAIRFSERKSVSKVMFPELEEALNAPYTATRSAAINLIIKTKDRTAIVILNNRLLVETNPVVKYELQQAIQELSR